MAMPVTKLKRRVATNFSYSVTALRVLANCGVRVAKSIRPGGGLVGFHTSNDFEKFHLLNDGCVRLRMAVRCCSWHINVSVRILLHALDSKFDYLHRAEIET